MPDGSPQIPDARIEAAVREVLGSVSGDLSGTEAMLLGELQGLAQEITRAKQEMAALQVLDINASQIPGATDELDAIVAHTADATNEILDACEGLERLSEILPSAQSSSLNAAVTRIYEACSFQDITGQRIAKVVKALKTIEERILAIEDRFGPFPACPPVAEAVTPETEGRALARGPQLPGGGTSQADIDSLLASFD